LFDGTSSGTVSGTISLNGDPVFLVQVSGSASSVNCNAGTNQTITLPTNSVTLSAANSTVTNSTISSYAWTQVSGPNTSTITNGKTVTATASNLIAGTYTFQVAIKDAKADSCSSTVQITVNAAVTVSITVSAGSNQTITLPTSTATLTGSVTDKTGTVKTYAWKEVSGPNTATISYPSSISTTVKGFVAGTYVFQLKVTDNNSASATANVQVTVKSSTSKRRNNSVVQSATASEETSDSTVALTESDSINNSQAEIVLFPNPSSGIVTLKVTGKVTGEMRINIYDMLGRPLIIMQTNKTQTIYQGSIDISKLRSGVYSLQVSIAKTQRKTVKLIRQ
jgi:hypothetical protein